MANLRTVALLAAISFLFQSVVWTVLALLGILAHTCHFKPTNDVIDSSFSAMAKAYFSDPTCWSGGVVLESIGLATSTQLITLSALQFVFNFLLAIVSLILMFVIPRGTSYTFLIFLYVFNLLSLGTEVLDLICAGIFSADKDAISTGLSALPQVTGLKNMLTIVTLISARGYLYWVLNFLLTLYLLIVSTLRVFKACKKWDEIKNQTPGQVNHAFEVDEQGYPKHSAISRWPWLAQSLDERQWGDLTPKRDRIQQRERAGFGNREALEQRHNIREYIKSRANADLLDSPRSNWNQDQRQEPSVLARSQPDLRENNWPKDVGNGNYRSRQDASSPRPNSLHEAILTVKPLRQVRPKLSEMRY